MAKKVKREEVPSGGARIDDFLVERYSVRLAVDELMESAPSPSQLSTRQARTLSKDVIKLGEGALDYLLELYVSPERERAHTAVALFLSLPEEKRLQALKRAMDNPRLGREAKIKLLALYTPDAESEPDQQVSDMLMELNVAPEDILSVVGGMLENMVSPEEIAELWVSDYAGMPVEDKCEALRLFSSRSGQEYLLVLNIERHAEDPRLRLEVARALRQIPFAESLEYACALSQDPDPQVRKEAEQAVAHLQRGGPLERKISQPQFVRAVCMADPKSGFVALTYVTRDEHDKYAHCSLYIDAWNRGISEILGDKDLSKQDLNLYLTNYEGDIMETFFSGEVVKTELSREHALYLIHAGLEQSRRKRRAVPQDYFIWDHLFSHEVWEFDPSQAIVRFEPVCSECGKKIQANISRSNVLAVGEALLCKKCVERQRKCTNCGHSFTLPLDQEKHAIRSQKEGLCTNCQKSQARRGKKA